MRAAAAIPAVLSLAWGLNWPVVKIVLGVLPPFSLRAWGLGGGALLLAAIVLVRGRSLRALRPPPAAWPGIVVGGLLTVAAFNFFTAYAQLATTTSRAAVLTFTMPMMAAALAWVFLGERPGRRGAAALALGAVGVGVLAWPVLAALETAPSGAWHGLLLPLAAAFAWAAGTVGAKRWPPAGDRLVFTAWQLGVAGACGFVAAALAGDQAVGPWTAAASAAMVFHVVVATALAYVLWYRLLDDHSATTATLTTLAVPVVGVLGAMALVGDRPGWLDAVGFVLVLGGAALAVLRGGGR